MKTKLIHLSLLASLTIGSLFAQEKTTVTAKNSDISDNLDLRAVATVFGDAKPPKPNDGIQLSLF